MKVVFLNNVRGIGRVGDVKEVNDGYARNFLFPRKLGKPATEGVVREAATLRARKLEAHSMEKTHAEALADRISGLTIVVHGKANDKGTLFSAIPTDDIARRISEHAEAHISPTSIESHEHLKHIGMHTINVRLSEHLVAEVGVDIQRQ
jgi:large subunit ribosomal protein L9